MSIMCFFVHSGTIDQTASCSMKLVPLVKKQPDLLRISQQSDIQLTRAKDKSIEIAMQKTALKTVRTVRNTTQRNPLSKLARNKLIFILINFDITVYNLNRCLL